MNKLKKISDKLDVKQLMEVKGGGKERHFCVFSPSVVIECTSGAVTDDDDKKK